MVNPSMGFQSRSTMTAGPIRHERSQPRWWRITSYVFLGINLVVSVGCLFSSWAVNAPSLGQYDFGIALSGAIISTISLYASLLLAGLSLLVAIGGAVARWALFAPLILAAQWVMSAEPIIDVHLHVWGDEQFPAPPHMNPSAGISSAQSQDEMIAETLNEMDENHVVLGLVHDDPESIERLRSKDPTRFRAFPDISTSEQPGVERFKK